MEHGMVRMRVAHLGLDRTTNTPVVVLREEEGERTLPIWIGASEANAIALELQGVKPERPLTHDLMKHLVSGLGGELRRVLIAGLRENTYLAQLFIYRGSEVFEVDARPSDSIALALRMNAPIRSRPDSSILWATSTRVSDEARAVPPPESPIAIIDEIPPRLAPTSAGLRSKLAATRVMSAA